MFFIHPLWNAQEVHPADQLESSLWIQLHIPGGSKLYIGNIYGKNETASAEERRQMYEQLENNISELSAKGPVVILGDMNARVGNQHDRVGKWREEFKSSNGSLLLELLESNNLICMNNRLHGPIQYTRRDHATQTVLDYVIVEEELEAMVSSVEVRRDLEVGSDHLPVIAELQLEGKLEKRNQKVIKKWRLERLQENWKEFQLIKKSEAFGKDNQLLVGILKVDQIDPIQHQQQTSDESSQIGKATVSGVWFQKKLMEGLKAELRKVDSKIDTMLELVDNYTIQRKQHQIEQIWSEWGDSVQKVVMQVIGKKSVNGKCKPWWDEELKNAILERRAFYKQTMLDGTGESWKQYRNLCKHTKWLCKQKKSLAWKNLAKKTKKACKDSDLKLFWNLVS